jgi:pantothenate kinase
MLILLDLLLLSYLINYKVLKALLDESKTLDVASVDLLATDEGKTLYEKIGFHQIEEYTAMRFKF